MYGEFETTYFKVGKNGFGGVVIDAENEEVASTGKIVFLSFEDNFAG